MQREDWRPPQPSQGRRRMPTSVRTDIRRNGKSRSSETTAGHTRGETGFGCPGAQPRGCSAAFLAAFLAFPGFTVSPRPPAPVPTFLELDQWVPLPSQTVWCKTMGQPGTRLFTAILQAKVGEAGLAEKERQAWGCIGHRGKVCSHLSHPSHRLWASQGRHFFLSVPSTCRAPSMSRYPDSISSVRGAVRAAR